MIRLNGHTPISGDQRRKRYVFDENIGSPLIRQESRVCAVPFVIHLFIHCCFFFDYLCQVSGQASSRGLSSGHLVHSESTKLFASKPGTADRQASVQSQMIAEDPTNLVESRDVTDPVLYTHRSNEEIALKVPHSSPLITATGGEEIADNRRDATKSRTGRIQKKSDTKPSLKRRSTSFAGLLPEHFVHEGRYTSPLIRQESRVCAVPFVIHLFIHCCFFFDYLCQVSGQASSRGLSSGHLVHSESTKLFASKPGTADRQASVQSQMIAEDPNLVESRDVTDPVLNVLFNYFLKSYMNFPRFVGPSI